MGSKVVGCCFGENYRIGLLLVPGVIPTCDWHELGKENKKREWAKMSSDRGLPSSVEFRRCFLRNQTSLYMSVSASCTSTERKHRSRGRTDCSWFSHFSGGREGKATQTLQKLNSKIMGPIHDAIMQPQDSTESFSCLLFALAFCSRT